MNISSLAVPAAIALVLGACASYRPVVDSKSIHDAVQYEHDLSDCQRYADQVSPGAGTVVGAILGAAFGAAVGYIAGDADLGVSAGLGALGGAVGGLGNGVRDQKDVIRICMRDRGYSVLN